MEAQDPDILLVEDNPEDLALALFALKKVPMPCRVQTVRDGEEALNFVFGRGPFSNVSPPPRPRLILLDLKLPKLTGLEVLRELKKNGSTRGIPVVIMTSSSQEKDLLECYEEGANSYIQKPIDFSEFQSIINGIGSYWLTINKAAPAARAS
jgi:two-component system response regulator